MINSGVAHHHAHGDYRTRRAECERAASLLGVAELRDVGVADLSRLQVLPSPLDRRARHVVTENQRVLDAVAAMRANDATALGALFDASHVSQRDDYECSVPEVDQLVAIAQADRPSSARGSPAAALADRSSRLVPEGEGIAAAARISGEYSRGRSPLVPLCSCPDGARPR